MTELALPASDLFETWADCVREFGDGRRDGSGDWQIKHFGPDRATFEALLELYRTESNPAAVLTEGHVHCDSYWIVESADSASSADSADSAGGEEGRNGPDMVGFMAVRHSIDTEFLRTLGGHIGYSIRPSRRRRGHAARALGLALDRAREIGLDRVLITCDHDNVGSARVIEGHGGVLDGVAHDNRRYWVTPDLPRRFEVNRRA